jgi:hypothetical protein
MRLKIDKMEHFHYRNIGQIGHFFMNFYYARYKKSKKVYPQISKMKPQTILTAVFFETGAMSVPTKLQNPTICG